jgi:hypothetical protein
MKGLFGLSKNGLLLIFAAAPLFLPLAAHAYSIKGGELLVRPVLGASVNVSRFSAATRATPEGGLLVGVDLDYAIDENWGVTGGLRPVFAPDFVDAGLLVGGKYRVTQLQAPFIPYGALALTTAAGFPTRNGDLHFNLGLRPAFGIDYFVMRDLAVGLEVGWDASGLFWPAMALEVSSEALLGVTWRW